MKTMCPPGYQYSGFVHDVHYDPQVYIICPSA